MSSLSCNPFTSGRAQSIPTAPSLLNYGDHKLILYDRLRQKPTLHTQTALPTRQIETNILRKYQQKLYESEYYQTGQEEESTPETDSRKSGSYWQNVREAGSQILVNPFKGSRDCKNREEVRRNTVVRGSGGGTQLGKEKSERQLMRQELAQLKGKLKSREKSRPKQAGGLIQFYKRAREAQEHCSVEVRGPRSDYPSTPSFAPTPTFAPSPSEFSFKHSQLH